MKNIYKFISSPSYQSTKYLFKFEFDITIQIQIRTHPRNHSPLSYLTNTRTRATRNLTIRYLFEDTRTRFIIPQLVVFPATDYHPPFTILGSTTTGSPALSFHPSRPSTRSITPTIRLYTGDIGRKRLGESITKQPISLDRYEDRSLPPSSVIVTFRFYWPGVTFADSLSPVTRRGGRRRGRIRCTVPGRQNLSSWLASRRVAAAAAIAATLSLS